MIDISRITTYVLQLAAIKETISRDFKKFFYRTYPIPVRSNAFFKLIFQHDKDTAQSLQVGVSNIASPRFVSLSGTLPISLIEENLN